MEIQFVRTSDTDLASTLYCMGFPIDGIHDSGRLGKYGEPIMEFYFRDEDRLRTVMADYYGRKLRVEPSELFFTKREIIDRVKYETSIRKLKEGKS